MIHMHFGQGTGSLPQRAKNEMALGLMFSTAKSGHLVTIFQTGGAV